MFQLEELPDRRLSNNANGAFLGFYCYYSHRIHTTILVGSLSSIPAFIKVQVTISIMSNQDI